MRSLHHQLRVAGAATSFTAPALWSLKGLSTTSSTAAPPPGSSKAGSAGTTSTVGERVLESFAFDFDAPLVSQPTSSYSPTLPPKPAPRVPRANKSAFGLNEGAAPPSRPPRERPKLFRGDFANTVAEEPTERFDQDDQLSLRQAQQPGVGRRPARPPQRFAGTLRRERAVKTRPSRPSPPFHPERYDLQAARPRNGARIPRTKLGRPASSSPRSSRETAASSPRHSPTLDLDQMRANFHPAEEYIDFNGKRCESPVSQNTIAYGRLRELCECSKCIHPTTRQRIQTPGEIHREMVANRWYKQKPSKDRLSLNGDWVNVKWDNEGKHQSRIHLSKLQAATAHPEEQTYLHNDLRRQLWDRQALEAKMQDLIFDYVDLYDKDGNVNIPPFHRLLEEVQKQGFVRIKGVPTEQTDNRTCELRRIAQTIGPIRNTFYGELWDVKNKANSTNVAYTDLNLGLHMDLLYMRLPPRFQLLHCLRNRVHGGESYFVDSFAVAQDFKAAWPMAAEILTRNRLTFVYDNDGHSLLSKRHVLPGSFDSLDSAIAWSPPFQGVREARFDLDPVMNKQYDFGLMQSLERWERHLEDPKYRVQFRMEEGEMVFFDNRRVLHARTAFRECTPEERAERGYEGAKEGESSRWLKGCYLDADDVYDRLIHWKRLLAAEQAGSSAA